MFYRLSFLYVGSIVLRLKFYLAWILADAVNNASGLGFNGYDSSGNAKWDLISNVDIINLEVKN
jgi:lysophospholipid acyltransferase 1/2